ncbi:chemotaxis protein CheW [Aestuariibacter sp. AA17]|uniref:Chemotaxis protein CheW n=1 Tax=Fluctibacter corallii TaxID=2984329 RepID=A0ABT3ADY3_9ALTE|nr:chemotaxis protein CheW [Aestuariibacter sp. AA17]MCV2886441.1 chemotaxis protein CheW [Aestuariibacter sp. AA17]
MEEASIKKLQVLSFFLDQDCFGAEISAIQEVIEYRPITRVPRSPDFMLGVINLRGQVIPVVDLRLYFSLNVSEPTVNTCIIIIDVKLSGESFALGLLADSVKEVVELDTSDIKPPPKLGNVIDNKFILGMVEYNKLLIILLSLARIFSDDELQHIADGSEPSETVIEESDGT